MFVFAASVAPTHSSTARLVGLLFCYFFETFNVFTVTQRVKLTERLICAKYLLTLSVIGVGVRLAVCLKGAKVGKSLFGGLRNQHAPKT